MRRTGLVLLCTLALASLVATGATAHSTPQIRAQQAHAQSVLGQINQIGKNLESVVQQYDGAQLELQRVKVSLRQNEHQLRLAQGNFKSAQKRIMSRVYSLYVNGAPSTLDVIAGAKSLSQMISRAESAQVLSGQDAALGEQALRYERSVQQRERQLQQLKRQREATVASLAAKKQQINAALAQQRQLLASIHTSIHQLQVQEAQREQRLREAVQARLRQEAAQRAAAARAAAAQAQAPAQGSSSSGSSGSSGGPPPPVNIPVGNGGAGHPEAAQIALRYLGVPYVWGGAGPSGFDCSGLVMYVYAQLGISLAHYTGAQWSETSPISASQAQAGDLVFFNGLSHVGIYIGGGQMVDAPHTGSVVRIDSIGGFGSIDGFRRVP
jgi:cell wall-associated NlpC family hydrolase